MWLDLHCSCHFTSSLHLHARANHAQVVADNWFEIDPDKPTLVAYIGGVTKHVIRHNTGA